MIPGKSLPESPSRLADSRPRKPRSRLPFFFFTFVLLTPIGCQKEEIQHYRVPKEDTGAETESKEPVPTRLLGIIVPQDNPLWFFKLSGPASAVGEQKDAFDRFISSVRFKNTGDKPVSWTLPEGWKEEAGGNAFSYATMRFQSQGVPLELTVSYFKNGSGSLLANINRWRGQLNLGSISEAKLPELTKPIEVDGSKGTFVDMLGTASAKGGGMRPPMTKPPPREEKSGKPITYDAPPGWEEVPDRAGLGRIVFKISDGDKSADASITPLGGQGGGLLANVNRWRREQLGLDKITEDQLAKESIMMEVGGRKATYVDLSSPEGPNRRRILGVSLIGNDLSWFFKLAGPYDLVGKQKSAFEAFLKTVRFTGGEE
jgi:hypothetical protein